MDIISSLYDIVKGFRRDETDAQTQAREDGRTQRTAIRQAGRTERSKIRSERRGK